MRIHKSGNFSESETFALEYLWKQIQKVSVPIIPIRSGLELSKDVVGLSGIEYAFETPPLLIRKMVASD